MPKKFPPKCKRDVVRVARRGDLSRGPDRLRYRLAREGVKPLPFRATIARALVRRGLVRPGSRRSPEVADRLHELADRTHATRMALVHGDVSPEHILLGPRGPVLLDPECCSGGS